MERHSLPMNANGALKMRVLFINHTAVLSGGELAMLECLQNMDQSKMECSVVLLSHGPLEVELEKIVPVEVLPLMSDVLNIRKDTLTGVNLALVRRLWSCIPFIFKLSRVIKQHNPDVVHTNSLKADIIGGIAARVARVPVLWHIRDRIAPDYLPGVSVKLMRCACRIFPDKVVGCSQAVLDTLHLSASNPGAVVYSGIDLSKFSGAASSNGAMPTQGIRYVGLVGRLAPWKGQHIFIDAAARLHKDYPDIRFLVIGSAMFGEKEYELTLREQVRAAGLENVVEFRGFVRKIEEEISRLDVLVHASTLAEPFGQTIVQGMAAGKPVIAARGGGASEIIRNGLDGLLIEGGSSELLEEAIRRLAEDPLLAAELGKQGRVRVQEKFTIQDTVIALTAALDEARKRKVH